MCGYGGNGRFSLIPAEYRTAEGRIDPSEVLAELAIDGRIRSRTVLHHRQRVPGAMGFGKGEILPTGPPG